MSSVDFSKARVLVVDDEPDSIDVVRMVLVANGATVFEARNGRAALEVMGKETLTMILSDLSMPFLDGWEMLKAMRADDKTKNLPVIALTAHARVGDKVLEAGFDGYMIKPLRMFTLIQDLTACMESIEKKRKEGTS
jgi:CheY-like chemotaxis protein